MPRIYTYGPFNSRRLGLSLGINILSNQKICTYNCVYCEIGLTSKENLVSPKFRVKIPPTHNFRKELASILKLVPHLNNMSFTGYYGEPTLNANFLDFHKTAYEVREKIKWTHGKPKLTLFTNSSTLYLEEIREKVKKFDLVLAKLDVATQEDFIRTNCPHKDTSDIEMLIESIAKLSRDMPNSHELAIQCLIYNSYSENYRSNNNTENIIKLAHAIKKIKPDSVQVYSVARIPANYYVFSTDKERKREIVEKFKEIINDKSIEIAYY